MEVNKILKIHQENPLKPSQIQSIVTRKKDLFTVKGGKISIHPDKYPFSLIATMEEYSGASNQVRVNFIKKRFIFLEWRNKDNIQPFADYPAKFHGSLEDFKRDIYSMKIWEWEPAYRNVEGIVLGGKFWSVKLSTKGRVYESEGTDCFPLNWARFCKAVEKLTGTPFR